MPTTPGGWAYLSGTDHPLEFPPVTQTNANKLEAAAIGPVSTTALTAFGSWSLLAGSKVHRRNGWVKLYGQVSKASAITAGEQIVWVPSGYAPAVEWFGIATGNTASGGGLKCYLISVDISSAIKLRGSTLPATSETLTLFLDYPL